MTDRYTIAELVLAKGTSRPVAEALLAMERKIVDQAREIARLREALGDLIKQCWSCEKELTEEYYGTHYSGESLPLCNARAALKRIGLGGSIGHDR